VIVRREAEGDQESVFAVHAAAFGREPGVVPVEAPLVDRLRADGWIDELSWVTLVDGQVVGHVVATRSSVDGRPALGLGPLGVLPGFQRRGVGSALVHAVTGAADALGEPLIVLLGNPAYYSRFGFVLAAEAGVVPTVAEWVPHFQVRTLSSYEPSLRGLFRYARPFDLL
jgi:putative acetyltransferase